MSHTHSSGAPPPKRHESYETAVREFGRALDRLAAGYEADPEKRHDLRQDIHFQLLRSFDVFDGCCSLKTWTFRVAHNTAVSYVNRQRRENAGVVSLEEIERTAPSEDCEPDIDQQRALQQLSQFIRRSTAWRGSAGAERGVSTLIVGIGGNAAIFTLLKTTFMDPLPHRDANRLVTLVEESGWNPSVSEFVDIRARSRTLEEMAFGEHRDIELTGTA